MPLDGGETISQVGFGPALEYDGVQAAADSSGAFSVTSLAVGAPCTATVTVAAADAMPWLSIAR